MPKYKSTRKASHKALINTIKLLLIVVVVIVTVGVVFINKNSEILTTPETIAQEVTSELDSFVKSLDIRRYFSEIVVDVRNDVDTADSSEQVTIARIALVSDSHGDVEVFHMTLRKVLADQADIIFHLGDTVAGGELLDLATIRDELDATGLPYEVIPGDHDYNWSPRYDLTNFNTVFGPERSQNRVFTFQGYHFIFFPNASQDASGDAAIAWLQNALSGILLEGSSGVFMVTAKPLTNPYFVTKQDAQGPEILELLKEYEVKEVFSGDTHIFTRYRDELTQIPNTTVGASGSYKNPLPQYVLLDLYQNGEYDVVAKPGTDAESFD